MMGTRSGSAPSLAVTALDSLLSLLADPEGAKQQLARLEKARADAKAATDALAAAQQAHDQREAELGDRARGVEQREGEQAQQAQKLATRQAGLDQRQRELDATAADLKTREAQLLADLAALRAETSTFQKEKARMLNILKPAGAA
jgi:chromosome segregation ATPase